MTNLATRSVVWGFWHDYSSESSKTTRPEKLRQSSQIKIQSGLKFLESVKTITRRGKPFYESMWRITHHSYQVLYKKFIRLNPDYMVSSGTFFALKAFYVRGVTTRDLDICACKLHLHARRMIEALIACSNKHQLTHIEFTDYYTFFQYIIQDCLKYDYTHTSWNCTPNKTTVCSHVLHRWGQVIDNFSLFVDVYNTDDDVRVHLELFKRIMVSTKFGETKRLTAVREDANMSFIIRFISETLSLKLFTIGMS